MNFLNLQSHFLAERMLPQISVEALRSVKLKNTSVLKGTCSNQAVPSQRYDITIFDVKCEHAKFANFLTLPIDFVVK